MQVVVQETLTKKERRAIAKRAVLLVDRVFPDPEELANWEWCQKLIPHALVCADHTEAGQLAFTEAAHLLDQAASYLYYRAKYPEALLLFKRALAIREQALGPDHPDVATGLNNLGVLYKAQGQDEQALPLFQRALKIREQVLGPDHPEVVYSLFSLARVHLLLEQYEAARPLLNGRSRLMSRRWGKTIRMWPLT